MLGNLDLGQVKDGLQFLDAERPFAEKRNESQPVRMTEALVDGRQAHGRTVFHRQYIQQMKYIVLHRCRRPDLDALVP